MILYLGLGQYKQTETGIGNVCLQSHPSPQHGPLIREFARPMTGIATSVFPYAPTRNVLDLIKCNLIVDLGISPATPRGTYFTKTKHDIPWSDEAVVHVFQFV